MNISKDTSPTQTLILASASQRRKDLLEKIGLPFQVWPSGIDEDEISAVKAEDLATKLALAKARHVAKHTQNAIFIGADTIVCCNDNILGKPKNRKDARSMLSLLSNNSHSVITGMAFIKTDAHGNTLQKITFSEQTDVTFHNLQDLNIDAYLESDIAMDKAGAYGIQNSWGALFVKSIDGDFFNVMGLPIQLFYRKLKAFAPEFLNRYHIS